MNEKRSSEQENAQPSLFEDGVGARHGTPLPPPGGGGYPETCTVFKFSARPPKFGPNSDPRLKELDEMGLQRIWLNVAEAIGVDAFLDLWRIIDADPSCRHHEGYLQPNLKLFSAYKRYQRNRYIEALAKMGLAPHEIHARLQRHLCESVSLRHISRIAGDDKL